MTTNENLQTVEVENNTENVVQRPTQPVEVVVNNLELTTQQIEQQATQSVTHHFDPVVNVSILKFGKSEKDTIAGIEYTFQFPGTKRAQQILDASKTFGGVFSDSAYNEALMKDVIVHPKTDWDYWDNHKGYREVMRKADTFLGRMLK